MPDRILWERSDPERAELSNAAPDITTAQMIKMGEILADIKQAEAGTSPPRKFAPAPQCRHIMPSGRRCRALRLKKERYCYFHIKLHFRKQTHRDKWPADIEDLPHLEDRASVQVNLQYVVREMLMDRIAEKKAKLLLYALQLAMNNTRSDDKTLVPEQTETDIHHGDYYFEQDVVSAEDDAAIEAERMAAGSWPMMRRPPQLEDLEESDS